MKQRTLAMMTGFEQYTRKTRRAIFLEEMEQVVPWGELCALVAPHYPQPGKGAAAGGSRAHAADLLFAAVVQPVGPGGGRDAVRLGGDAAVRGRRGSRSHFTLREGPTYNERHQLIWTSPIALAAGTRLDPSEI